MEVRQRELGIELDDLVEVRRHHAASRADHVVHQLAWIARFKHCQIRVGIGQPGGRRGVVRVLRGGLFEINHAFADAFFGAHEQ